MKAIVLSYDKYHPITDHMIRSYEDVWLSKILCFTGMLQAVSILNNPLLFSIGRSDVVFLLSIIGLILYLIYSKMFLIREWRIVIESIKKV